MKTRKRWIPCNGQKLNKKQQKSLYDLFEQFNYCEDNCSKCLLSKIKKDKTIFCSVNNKPVSHLTDINHGDLNKPPLFKVRKKIEKEKIKKLKEILCS